MPYRSSFHSFYDYLYCLCSIIYIICKKQSICRLLIRASPVNHLLSRFFAADTCIRQVLLFKRHAPGCGACFLFNLILALLASAPHCLYKPWLIVNGVHKSIPINRFIGVGIPVALALSYIAFCMVSSISETFVSSSSREMKDFSWVSRRTRTAWFFSMSFGPISTRRGIPRISQSANFQPGLFSESSVLTEKLPS